jgi:autotransporter passenger strand-loop-strand repeat protein
MTTLGINDQWLTEWIYAGELQFFSVNGSATLPGHSDDGVIVDFGGEQYVEAGGTALDTTLNNDGRQEVDTGGTAFNTTVNSGVQTVSGGGIASGTVLHDGGEQLVLGGTTVGTLVQAGVGNVYSGKAFYTVLSAGTLTVSNGGVTSRTMVGSGCYEVVASGGTARFTTVSNGGFQTLLSDDLAISTTVSSGGTQLLGSPVPLGGGRAIASGTQVSSGGVQDVLSGGVAIDTTIFGGGSATGGAPGLGGTFVNPTISGGINSAGLLALYSGTEATGAITFGPTGTVDSGGTLMIFGSGNGAAMPDATIDGFSAGDGVVPGDSIHLPDVPLVSGASIIAAGSSAVSYGGCTLFETTKNVLQVYEGGYTYKLQFDPFQTFSGGFVVSGDASGGVAGGTVVQMSSSTVTGYSTSALPPSPWGIGLGLTPPNPYLATCEIRTVNSAGTGFRGTGFIIGPRTILTAAHVLENTPISGISVFPGTQTGGGASINLSGAQVHTGTSDPDTDEPDDYAIIDLPDTQDIASAYGMFLLGSGAGTVNITGYPGQFNHRESNYIASVSPQKADSRILDERNADTSGGNSGGPDWVYNGGYIEAVGIHVSHGTAVAITPSVISTISSWQDSDFGSSHISSGQTFPSSELLDDIGIQGGNTGTAFNTVVDDGGVWNNTGAAYNTVVDNGGVLNDAGTAVNIDVQAGGVVNATGTAVDIAVSGTLNVGPGGTAGLTTVYPGGVETISSGGTDLGGPLLGGSQGVFGRASNTTISSGGVQVVYSGGTANDTTINNLGQEIVSGGGTVNATTINSGGIEAVRSGGAATSTIVNGGFLVLNDGVAAGAR